MTHVTIPPMDTPLSYTASASQTVFAITFPFWSADDIVVVVDGVVLDPSDFVVAGSSLQDGSPVTGAYGSGTGTLNAACAGGETVVIDRLIDPERLTDFSSTGPFSNDALNSDLDKLTARDQDLNRGILRSLRTMSGETLDELPAAAERAGGYMGFDLSGQPTVLTAALGGSTPVSTFGAGLVATLSAHTAQGLLGFDLGTGTPTVTDHTAVRLTNLITSHPAGGDHGFRDDSMDSSTTGFLGRASYDTVATITGAGHWNHQNGVQVRTVFSGSGEIDGINSYTSNITITSGKADFAAGVHFYAPQVAGGVLTQSFLTYAEESKSASTNLGHVQVGTGMTNVFDGVHQSNTRLQAPDVRVSSFTHYGEIPTTDTNGSFLENASLTYINGDLEMNRGSGGGSLGLQRNTTTERDALTSRRAGDLLENTTVGRMQRYSGAAWYDQPSGIVASTTYDPGSLVDAAGTTTTVAATGAVVGDPVSVGFSNDLQGITVTGWVSSANTVSVRFQNESGGTLDLASGTLKVIVFKV